MKIPLIKYFSKRHLKKQFLKNKNIINCKKHYVKMTSEKNPKTIYCKFLPFEKDLKWKMYFYDSLENNELEFFLDHPNNNKFFVTPFI